MAHGRAGWPGRLVEIDDTFLGGDEERERDDRLRDRGEADDRLRVPVGLDAAVRLTTPAAANGTGQASIWRSACTRGDTSRPMERRLISGHSPFEPVMGFSRAVVAGGHVYVAGTAPIRRRLAPPEDAYEQTRLCLESSARRSSERARASRRRADARIRHRPGALRRGLAGTRRGVPRDPAGERDRRHKPCSTPRGRSRSRSKPCSLRHDRLEAGVSALDHGQGRCPRWQRPRPRIRQRRSVHARGRGGVPAPRRRELRPRPAHRHDARRGERARARGAHQPRAHAVGRRDHDPRLPDRGRGDAELVKLRGYITEVAHGKGFRVGSAGTHPFSLFERQRITAKDRYHALIDQMQYVARRELIFGMHVHVAVDDPEKAIKVVNGLLPQLAPLLALSASSPFWRGEATGLASSRQMVFSAFPRSGRRRASATTPTSPTSSGSSSARAASPTTPTSGGTSACTRASARSRSGSATRSRGSRTQSRSRPIARRS